MSEEKKEKSNREILQELLAPMQREITELKNSISPKNNKAEPQSVTVSNEEAHHGSHWHAEDFINASDNCPECKTEKAKLSEAFGKPYLEQHWREKLPLVCENCGTGVMKDEEECPTCKGTKAKRRE